MRKTERILNDGIKEITYYCKVYEFSWKDLDPGEKRILKKAKEAQKLSIFDYSGYKVGAVVCTAEGEIFEGANYEDVAYNVIHAEEAAISHAFSHRVRPKDIAILAVYCKDGGLPCSYCRQKMVGYGLSRNLCIFGFGKNGKIYKTNLEDLVVMPFAKFTK